MRVRTPIVIAAAAASVSFGLVQSASAAPYSWTGLGGATTDWGTAANWDSSPALPDFNGTDSLTVTSGFGVNTALTLGADRSIGRITFGGGGTEISLSGNTLRLNSTSTTAAAGNALWNANTADNKTATVNSNLLLQSGTSGNYTGYFWENNNSSGGTRFNGTITQGAGENWTLRFKRASARGQFFLNNSANSFAGFQNDGADVYSENKGSFGGGTLTLNGGITGTRSNAHYTGTDAITNNVVLTATSTWSSGIETRMTGSLSGNSTLSYAGGALTRLEHSSVSGTGSTSLLDTTLAVSGMNQLRTGSLDLGSSSAGPGVFVLSGSSGNGVPTWSDFTAARTFNQSGGTGNWRINIAAGTASNSQVFGGFAARGGA